MILDAENRQAMVPEPFQSLVVEIDVAGLDLGRQGRGIDRKAVVLRCDLDLTGLLVPDRMIGATVAELELECASAEGLAQELMSQADAEDGNTPAPAAVRINVRKVSVASVRAAGSPGPLEMKIPSGSYARIDSAVAEPGETVTWKP